MQRAPPITVLGENGERRQCGTAHVVGMAFGMVIVELYCVARWTATTVEGACKTAWDEWWK